MHYIYIKGDFNAVSDLGIFPDPSMKYSCFNLRIHLGRKRFKVGDLVVDFFGSIRVHIITEKKASIKRRIQICVSKVEWR